MSGHFNLPPRRSREGSVVDHKRERTSYNAYEGASNGQRALTIVADRLS